MSESVACALEHTGGKEVEETVKFIRMTDIFFDTLNVTNLVNGKRKDNHFNPHILLVMIFESRYVYNLRVMISDSCTYTVVNYF